MSAPTRPATPAPPTPAAAPCLRCGRDDGYLGPRRVTPRRTHGYCNPCATLLWHLVRQHGYADYDEAHIAHPRGSVAPQTTALAARKATVWARENALRDRSGPLITVALSTGRGPFPLPDNGDTGGWGGACDPAWKPAPWYAPLATDDAARAA